MLLLVSERDGSGGLLNLRSGTYADGGCESVVEFELLSSVYKILEEGNKQQTCFSGAALAETRSRQ